METTDKMTAREAQMKREFFETNGATRSGTYNKTMSPPNAAGPIPNRKTFHSPRFSGVCVGAPTIALQPSLDRYRVIQGIFRTTADAVAARAPANPKPAARVDPPETAAVSNHSNALSRTTKITEGLKAKVMPKSNDILATSRILCSVDG